jgi:hypothetical protein
MARSPTDTIRFLTLEELARLFAVVRASPRNHALFLIAYRHGLRDGAVAQSRDHDRLAAELEARCRTLGIEPPPPDRVERIVRGAVLAQPHWVNRLTPRDRHAITPLIWDHVNLYGRYELDTESRISILT